MFNFVEGYVSVENCQNDSKRFRNTAKILNGNQNCQESLNNFQIDSKGRSKFYRKPN